MQGARTTAPVMLIRSAAERPQRLGYSSGSFMIDPIRIKHLNDGIILAGLYKL